MELSKAEKSRNHRFADMKRFSAELPSLNAKTDAHEEELEELATSQRSQCSNGKFVHSTINDSKGRFYRNNAKESATTATSAHRQTHRQTRATIRATASVSAAAAA